MSNHEDGIAAIIRAMEDIEARIEESITLESVARTAGYSPYHFARMFSFAVGYTVMEHVRRRKLWHAAAAIKRGDSVLSVALRYGFQSHEGFTRAFGRVFKMSPSKYRRVGAGIVPPVPYPATIEGGLIMKPEFITRETTRTIGYMIHTTPQSPEIPAYWETVMQNGSFERLMKKSAKMENFGICIMPKDNSDGLDYVIAFDASTDAAPDADMIEMDLPGGLFAMFHATDHTAIREVWTHVYTQWLPQSEYEFDTTRYDFELYPDEKVCDIYIPIKKK